MSSRRQIGSVGTVYFVLVKKGKLWYYLKKQKRIKIMTEEKIKRINELAKKSREQGLTDQEKEEQLSLRREYIDSFRKSLETQLDSIVVEEKDGSRHKLNKKCIKH